MVIGLYSTAGSVLRHRTVGSYPASSTHQDSSCARVWFLFWLPITKECRLSSSLSSSCWPCWREDDIVAALVSRTSHTRCDAVSVLELSPDISDAEHQRGGGPLRPPIVHSKPCRSMRTTVVPVASRRPSRSSVWRGADVEEECYLVDPASSHMLVSKIKPCMCKYEQIQTVKLRMAH